MAKRGKKRGHKGASKRATSHMKHGRGKARSEHKGKRAEASRKSRRGGRRRSRRG
jgi:hypothetical protein